jgi:beta-fructofuranosidase
MHFVLRNALLTSLALLLWPICSLAESTDDALARATAAVHAAAPRAQSDPAHPIFHVTAPAQWINDPNGPIFHKGLYHLFYQLHPFSDGDGPKYWGHVRSRDLVKWEHLPIALAPSDDAGELGVWSGCCVLNGAGKPMIFYTSVAHGKSALTHSEQWAATSDDDLVTWHKSPANPVLSDALHGGVKIYDWRDPFIFREGQRTFMVLGGSLNQSKGGQAVVNIYEAEDAGLLKWTYRGVLFQHPDREVRTAECPNFFKLGNQWVLFVSPYGKVQYFVGDFDAKSCRFQPRTRGLLDYGPNFYAPNTMLLPNGGRLLWGWVNGFPRGHEWNGCLSLPRQLSLSPDGQLRQEPVPQLSKLHDRSSKRRNLALEGPGEILVLPRTNTLEIQADIDLQTATAVALEFKTPGQPANVTVRLDRSELTIMDSKAPLHLSKGERRIMLRIFLDRSVLEVFANETVCLTKTIKPLAVDSSLELRAQGGKALAKRVEAWPMKTIW